MIPTTNWPVPQKFRIAWQATSLHASTQKKSRHPIDHPHTLRPPPTSLSTSTTSAFSLTHIYIHNLVKMVVRIRLARFGRKRQPFYNIVVSQAKYVQIFPPSTPPPSTDSLHTHTYTSLHHPIPSMRSNHQAGNKERANNEPPGQHATANPSKS